MKCANCGAELKVGCMYCSVCGKEAQIVSDYNLLEDDFLRDMLKEREDKIRDEAAREAHKREALKNCASLSHFPLVQVVKFGFNFLSSFSSVAVSFSLSFFFTFSLRNLRPLCCERIAASSLRKRSSSASSCSRIR